MTGPKPKERRSTSCSFFLPNLVGLLTPWGKTKNKKHILFLLTQKPGKEKKGWHTGPSKSSLRLLCNSICPKSKFPFSFPGLWAPPPTTIGILETRSRSVRRRLSGLTEPTSLGASPPVSSNQSPTRKPRRSRASRCAIFPGQPRPA